MDRVLAIVGRPNVGKSALFNRLAGKRIAIVHDRPGVTRDRLSMVIDWHGEPITLIDTGGIGLSTSDSPDDDAAKATLEQAQIAIESAQIIVQVVDIRQGILPLDYEVAERLRQSAHAVIVAANKADESKDSVRAGEFSRLGFTPVLPISAIHGLGIDELTQAIDQKLKIGDGRESTAPATDTIPQEEEPMKLAIVGRPNVGKSSLVNALGQNQRVIVSPVPGTTRDAVDVPFQIETEHRKENWLLIDTAGIRKRRRVNDSVEYFSVKRSENAIARADIVVHVFDAQDGVTVQDKKIASVIIEQKKSCVLVVNKWDLYAEELRRAGTGRKKSGGAKFQELKPTLQLFGEWVQQQMFFLDYAPVIFTSAHNGFHLERLLETIRLVADQLNQTVPTGILNRTLRAAFDNKQPPIQSSHRLKFFYATQIRLTPPTFLLFVNQKKLLSDAYEKYLTREIRKAFGYEGCPVVFVPKTRTRTIEPIRRTAKPPRNAK